jgi:exopolysaccharide biosynthesis operon protein EpsL
MATTRISRAAWPLAALLAAPLPAAALFNDRVEVFAAENVTYDSNVFRLSKDVDPTAAVGHDSRSDTISTTSLGANLDVPWSLQRFQASYTWFANRYHNFKELDFDGHLARAAWLWSVTPHLTGDVGYTDSLTLANFANRLAVSRNRDILHTKQGFANAVWFPVASWRIHGGVAEVDQRHDDPTESFADIQSTTGVAGVSYVTPADDRLGVEVREERGRSPHEEFREGPLDIGYRQTSAGVVAHWVATGHSLIDARTDWVKRDYDRPAFPDFSGPIFRVAHTWTPTGKLTILSSIYRDIGPIADVQSGSLVLIKGVAVKPSWAATEKITIAGDAEYNVWDYKQDVVQGSYTHRVRTFGATVSYRPTTKILLQGGYTHEMRTSTVPLADYKDDVASISARISF